MNYNDLIICKKNHSTSKIQNIEDLYNLNTLGMRGEALFSIDVCSKMIIFSKTMNDNGYKLELDNIEIAACNNGTRVEVHDLFYNIPVRQKFLKSNEYEYKLCEEVIEAYALCYSNIVFTIKHNNKAKSYSSPMIDIFNVQKENQILINQNLNSIEFNGYLLSGLTTGKCFLFINKRWVKNRKLIMIIKKTYKEISGRKNIPFVLFINCSPSIIDVNVHPSKMEIKFSLDIEGYLYEAIQNSFKNSYAINNALIEVDFNNIYLPFKNQTNSCFQEKILDPASFYEEKIISPQESTLFLKEKISHFKKEILPEKSCDSHSHLHAHLPINTELNKKSTENIFGIPIG
jgi:DNA mismatch repair protein MutL